MAFKALVSVLVFAPLFAVAAPKSKKVTRTTATTTIESTAPAAAAPAPAAPVTDNRNTTIFSGSNANLGLKGLSIFAAYDFADTIQVSGGSDINTEKAFSLGGQYEFSQLAPGIAPQIGGTYDFERTVKNSNGVKYNEWTVYGEAAAHLTPQLKIMGGLNYNIPNISGVAAEAKASLKGKMGYQIGASFQVAKNFAIDGRYRTLEMDLSASNGEGGTTTTGLKVQGLMINGSYLF